MDRDYDRVFENARPTLMGLAYRMLGSRADAEDAVQDTFVKWASADQALIENDAAWLTATCTRRCLDMLRAAHRKRVDYVGAWLPEPIQTPIESDVQDKLDLSASLTTAFLLMLERLTPKERAAYILHDIFDVSYDQVAATLDIREEACRKLVSRAKASIGQAKVRHITPAERQDQLLSAFKGAIAGGNTGELTALLSEDVRLSADGGGKVPAVLETLHGKPDVLAFVSDSLRSYWAGFEWLEADINGTRGVIVRDRGEIHAAVSFAYDDAGRVTDIYIVRNPDKLIHLDDATIH
ncbi:MAG: RNA polymerase sigma factor SigJ [Pseudomonadota bacterium]